ncbi:MAG: hypothetical protein KBA31_18230 [Alphaproteobacteria bacterium]|nr:hypothetical protein [Alphaproteobacteria bacterium]
MGVFNGFGVVFAALSLVLLVKHGFDMGTFAAPLDLALTYYEDVTRVLVGWIAPLAQRAAALAGFELSFQPHWKHFFLLTLLYCGAWTRASGGEKGSRVFDAVWGVVMALAAGLAAGLVPVAPGAEGAADAILIAAFPIAAVLLFDIGDSIWLRFSVRVLMNVKTDVTWWEEVLSFSRSGINLALVGFGAVALGILVSHTAFVRALPAPGLLLLVGLATAAAVAVIAKAAREARTGGRIAAENDPARDAKAAARAIFRRDPLRRFGVNILAALGGAAAFIAANAGLRLAGL